MNNSTQNQTEMTALNYEQSLGSTESAETNEDTTMPIKDQDTIVSMIVLSLACLALAVLAHVIVQ